MNTNILRITNNIYLKLEGENESGSIYDKCIKEIMSAYESSGKINDDTTIITSSDGYFGLSLAYYCFNKKYKYIICMPNDISNEIIDKIEELGGMVVLTPSAFGLSGSDDMANDMVTEISNSVFISMFKEKKSVSAHFKITGPEIYNQIPNIDILICNVLSGATITGTSKYLKMKKDVYSIGIRNKKFESLVMDDDYIDKIIDLNGNYEEYGNELKNKYDVFTKYPELYYQALEVEKNSPDKKIIVILPDGKITKLF